MRITIAHLFNHLKAPVAMKALLTLLLIAAALLLPVKPAHAQAAVSTVKTAPVIEVGAGPAALAPGADQKAVTTPAILGKAGGVMVISLTFGLMLVAFGFVAHGLYRTKQVAGERDWRFADALSEDVVLSDPQGVLRTVLVASTSRLIAVFGLILVMAIYLGVGAMTLWTLAVTGKPPGDLDSMLKFLAGGGALFAPYLFNQIRAGLEKKSGTAGEPDKTSGGGGTNLKPLPVPPGPTL